MGTLGSTARKNEDGLSFLARDTLEQLVGVRKQLTRAEFYTEFTGSISGSVLTVTAVASGAIRPGFPIWGANVTPGTVLASVNLGSGTGGTGTYTLTTSQTAASGVITMGAVANERARITYNAVGIYSSGEEFSIIGEIGTRTWVLGSGGSDAANAAASHARNVILSGSSIYLLANDTAKVIATTGAPAGGTGAVDDVAFDQASGLRYVKTGASTWGAGVSTSGAPAVVNDLTTGGTTAPLSAQQGVVLKRIIDNKVPTPTHWGTRMWAIGSVGPNTAVSIFLGGTFLDNGTDKGTEHVAIELGEFTAVQLIYMNNSFRSPLIITGARAIAPSDYSDKVRDSEWAAAPAFTFNGAPGATLYPGLASSFLLSDPLPLSSIPRTDVVGALPLLYTRTLFDLPQGGVNSLCTSLDTTGSDWTNGSRLVYSASAYGDKLTTALGRTPAPTGRRVLAGIRYLSPNRVMTIMATGTSLTNNSASTLLRQPGGWLHAAAVASSTPSRMVEFLNWGMSTQSSTQYRGVFERASQQLSFTHALIEGYSVNDMANTVTQGAQDINIRNVLAIAEVAQRLHRARVGVWSGLPRSLPNDATQSYFTLSADNARKAYLARIAGLGYDYADVSNIFGDDATPQRIRMAVNGYPADYTFVADGLHPNQAGTEAITPAFTALFQQWADAYFA